MNCVFGLGRRVILAGVAISSTVLVAERAWSEPCDVDEYVTKAIGIEEPWLENAGYLFIQATHSSSPEAVTLSPEIEARFSDRLGMELDLPGYTAQEPLRRGRDALGPLAAGLKAVGFDTCDPSHERTTLLTGEIEGQYWADPRHSVLPGEGNSVTGQVMWTELWNSWFSQGEVGYTRGVGPWIISGWFLNTSIGRPLNSVWAAQLEIEIDNQTTLLDGHRGIEGSVMPQISYRPSTQWLVALGEQASRWQGNSQTGWSTWLMMELDFSDTDGPD